MEEPPVFGGNPGEPVPPVDPEDLKTLFEIFQDATKHHPGGGVGVDLEVFKHACKADADIPSLTYRAMMLQLLLSHAQEQLALWTKEGQLDFAVFREAAQLPMEWIGVGVERQGLPFDIDELFRRLRGKAA
jgi:hypothetical protein